jgi:signal peptidase II
MDPFAATHQGVSEAAHPKRVGICVAVAATAMVIDLVTKAAVTNLPAARTLPFVVLLHNPSFTLGAGGNHKLLLPIASAAMILIAAWWLTPAIRTGHLRATPAGLIIGSAASNLTDRVLHGQVTDFISTGWLVINLADLGVLAGLLMLLSHNQWRHLLPAARRQLLAPRPDPSHGRDLGAPVPLATPPQIPIDSPASSKRGRGNGVPAPQRGLAAPPRELWKALTQLCERADFHLPR